MSNQVKTKTVLERYSYFENLYLQLEMFRHKCGLLYLYEFGTSGVCRRSPLHCCGREQLTYCTPFSGIPRA